MTNRLNKIFSVIPRCDTFSDVACDHGYVAERMLKENVCNTAYVSDISAKSLSKAENLLSYYIKTGRAKAVVSDGFDNLPKTDVALIAGLGGEEITKILSRSRDKLPDVLILQPMKHCDKVRKTCVYLGYKIQSDRVFCDGVKFYNLIVLIKGEDSLTEEEAEFGRSNVYEKGEDFVKMIKEEINKTENYLKSDIKDPKEIRSLKNKLEKMKKYV